MALTLDGFLPHEDEMLMRWVRENKRYGFPRWQRQATFHIYPHYGLMDLLNVREKYDKDCIYLAEVGDGGSAEYVNGLFLYNLVDETVLYLLPLSYGRNLPDWRIPVCLLETSWLQNFLQRNLPAYI